MGHYLESKLHLALPRDLEEPGLMKSATREWKIFFTPYQVRALDGTLGGWRWWVDIDEMERLWSM